MYMYVCVLILCLALQCVVELRLVLEVLHEAVVSLPLSGHLALQQQPLHQTQYLPHCTQQDNKQTEVLRGALVKEY